MPLTAAAPLPTPTALLFGLTGCLVDFGARARPGQRVDEHRQATPGALEVLQDLKQLGVPCAWMDELPHEVSLPLTATLPVWIKPAGVAQHARWPAPNACWQALMELGVQQLEGCVLVSGEPRLLQSGLNAGLLRPLVRPYPTRVAGVEPRGAGKEAWQGNPGPIQSRRALGHRSPGRTVHLPDRHRPTSPQGRKTLIRGS